jgi:hypothetical protein
MGKRLEFLLNGVKVKPVQLPHARNAHDRIECVTQRGFACEPVKVVLIGVLGKLPWAVEGVAGVLVASLGKEFWETGDGWCLRGAEIQIR